MAVMTDPTYLRLYREYADAIRAYENAVRDRRRVRNHLAVHQTEVMRALQAWNRRPVGSPPGGGGTGRGLSRQPSKPPTTPTAGRRIYMGPILGWARIVPTTPVEVARDAGAEIDVNKLYDQTSLRLYWNAKRRYDDARKAFFDHTRRSNIDVHRGRARTALARGAENQLLGLDEGAEAFLDQARTEVEAACVNALRIYRSSPEPKNDEVKILLLRGLADAQLLGQESTTTAAMTTEMNRMIAVGQVRKESQ